MEHSDGHAASKGTGLDSQKIPKRLRRHLQPGERVWWVGRPNLFRSVWRRAFRAVGWGMILGLLVGEALALWEIANKAQLQTEVPLAYASSWFEALQLSGAAIPWDVVLGLGLGAAAILFALDCLQALGKLYAITDRAFLWLRWWGLKPLHISLEEAYHLEATHHLDGTGTLFFANVSRVSFDSIVEVGRVAVQAGEAAQQAGFSEPDWEVGQHLPSTLFLAPGCSSLILMGVSLAVALTGESVVEWHFPLFPPGVAMAGLVLLLYGSMLAIYRHRAAGCRARLALVLMGFVPALTLVLLVSVFSALLRGVPQGAQAIRLSTHRGEDRFPAWSPDSQELAFASDRRGEWDIWVMNVQQVLQGEKEGAVRLLADAGGVDRAPAWSPDGRKIAFVSSFVDDAGGTEERIYAVRPDGHELSLLWPDLGGESPVYGITLSWSPDGSSLICGDEIVYELTVDGFTASAPKRIVAGYTPDLSLDGTRLALAVTRSDGLPNDLDLQVMALDGEGGDWVNLTRRIERAGGALNESHDPEWSPDGTQIAFVDGEEMIYVVNVDAALRGGNEATIAWVTRGRDPAWSPDGRRLAFAYRRGGNWDLYVAAAEPADARSALTQRGLAAMVTVALLILVSGRGAAFTLLVALSAALVGAVMGSPDGLTGASHMATTGAFWGAWTGFTVGTVFWLGVWALYTSWTRRIKSAGIPRP